MDSGWQPYQDPLMGHPAQFNTGLASHPQQLGSKYGQPPQSQPPVGYTYESFQTPRVASKAPSTGPNSKPVSMASSPTATPRSRDYVTDADTTMEDADPYNRAKYPSRANHHNRASSQFLAQTEESSAARKYSPMNVLSPPMSYPTSPSKNQSSYGFSPTTQGQSRRSPTRAPDYSSPPQGYQSPPCEYLDVYGYACQLLMSLSQSSPTATSPPGWRSESRPILSAVRLLAYERCIRNGVTISTRGLYAPTSSWSRAGSQVPKDQVGAGSEAQNPRSACISARKPRGRLHQRRKPPRSCCDHLLMNN